MSLFRNISIMFFMVLFIPISNAFALPNGSIAPDFTVTDLDGTEHNLYSILESGKTVVLEFGAVWCPACWNYHTAGHLDAVKAAYGDDVEVFFMESYATTDDSALYGEGSTLGNWVSDHDFNFVNLTDDLVKNAYEAFNYPTIYSICPNKRVYSVGTLTFESWENRIASCDLEVSVESVDHNICSTDNLGIINLDVNGGYAQLTYNWSNGQTGQNAIYLSPGDYSVTVSDFYGHSVVVEDVTIESPEPIQVVEEVFNVSCFGGDDGMISVDVVGGSAPYTFFWEGGGPNGPTYNNLEQGEYGLTVTDANGCDYNMDIDIEQPDVVSIMNFTILDSEDYLSTGSINVEVSGGTMPYIFTWTDVDGNIVGEGESLENVQGGGYILSVTDANFCASDMQFFQINGIPPNTTATEDISHMGEEGIKLYPNPSTGLIHIELDKNRPVQVSILNADGRLIEDLGLYSGLDMQFDVSDLSQGIYFLRVLDEETIRMKRFIKK